MRRSRPISLGPLELAVLDALWTQGPAGVQAVHAAVGDPRGLATNTIQTTLERLVRGTRGCTRALRSGSIGAGERRVIEDAFEVAGDPGAGPFLFICEHATRRLPEWEAHPDDLPFLEDHWGWDVGAADLTRELARLTGGGALLSRFSRLVCDANRAPEEPSFVVREVDGRALSFNRAVDDAERARRSARYFEPYHAAIDRALAQRVAARRDVLLCSIHSFTSVWDGRARPMDVGVLYDDHDAVAARLADALTREGFVTAHNEPYSGLAGLIYSARRHGRAHGVAYLELEVRNDAIASPERAQTIAPRIARALSSIAPGET